MILNVPFRYTFKAIVEPGTASWRSKRHNPTYEGAVDVDIVEVEGASPAFVVGSRLPVFIGLNHPGEPSLFHDGDFLVPLSRNEWQDGGYVEVPIRLHSGMDRNEIQAFLKDVLGGKTDRYEALGRATRLQLPSEETFDFSQTCMRGKPSIKRVDRRYGDDKRHPEAIAAEEVNDYVRSSVRLIDGRIYLRSPEPVFVIEAKGDGTFRTKLRTPAIGFPDAVAVFPLNEIDAEVERLRGTGLTIAHDPVEVLDSSVLAADTIRHRVGRTLGGLIAHLAGKGRSMSAGDLEVFLECRDIPFDREADPEKIEEGWVARAEAVSALMDLARRMGATDDLPHMIREADVDCLLEGFSTRDGFSRSHRMRDAEALADLEALADFRL